MRYSEHVVTRIDDFEQNGTMKPSSLLRFFENTVMHHMYSTTGILPEEMPGRERWVLAEWRVEILAVPESQDTMRAETWMTGEPSARSATMQLLLYRGDGFNLARATARFARVNAAGKPIEVDAAVLACYRPEKRKVFADELPRMMLPQTFTAQRTMPMRKVDMDFLGHAHNTVYMDLASEMLPDAPFDGPGPHSLRIVYRRSLMRGDTATLKYACVDGTHTVGIFSGEQVCAMVALR